MEERRRRTLQALGTLGVMGLAGCTGVTSPDDPGGGANTSAETTASESTTAGSGGCDSTGSGDTPSLGSPGQRLSVEGAGETNDFAWSLALDDATALVGAPGATKTETPDAAYVFERDGDEWSETAELVPKEQSATTEFGRSVALAGDTALVGAPQITNDDVEGGLGSAYVFERADGGWTETATLTPDDRDTLASFGHAVALTGNTAFVGAPERRSENRKPSAVYVFERGEEGWSPTAKLTPDSDAAPVAFGNSIAVSGTRVLVGAPVVAWLGDSTGEEDFEAAAYAFDRADGEWTTSGKLVEEGYEGGASTFGNSVALAGGTALVGDTKSGSDRRPYPGTAIVFERGDDGWSRSTRLTADDGDGWDKFGSAVALTCGGTAFVGAIGDEDPNGEYGGATYVFASDDGEWSQVEKAALEENTDTQYFGGTITTDGETTLVGARGIAAYAYDL